ncbi:DUF1983 domain-containing protein, partial [Xenorhabdus khoisanae]|uniref:DUF1983 domain-containing protein n=1 Tax=Xenorhabdus khoisanae TaxID=880157 RepID=UPI0032B79939
VFDIDGNGYAIYDIGAGLKYKGELYKAGLVIGGEVKNGKVETHIGVRANQFTVVNPSNGKMEPVFVIKNGQVFFGDAFIDKASMREAVLSDAIKSKNYVRYKAGFLINAVTGDFEFNDMRVQAGLRWANGAIACYDQNGRIRAAMGYLRQFR